MFFGPGSLGFFNSRIEGSSNMRMKEASPKENVMKDIGFEFGIIPIFREICFNL